MLSDVKRQARTALHAEMGEPCRYITSVQPPVPSAEQLAEGLVLSVRFQSKLRTANAEPDGLAILENVESLIFNSDQLAALEIELESGALIDIPGYGIVFRLDQQMDPDGPLNVYWTVVREA